MHQKELARIYDEHAKCAAALFRRFATCDADIRDLLQVWLIKVVNGVDSLETIQNERTYLLRIAYRVAVDWSRRQGVRKRGELRLADQERQEFQTEADPDRELLRDGLENSMEELPHEQRLVVQLKLWDGLTFSEIGEVLSISSNTASSRYRYGISKLQDELQPLYDELCADTAS